MMRRLPDLQKLCVTPIKVMMIIYLAHLSEPLKVTSENGIGGTLTFKQGSQAVLICNMRYPGEMQWKYESTVVANCFGSYCNQTRFDLGEFQFLFNTSAGIFRWIISSVESKYHHKQFGCYDGHNESSIISMLVEEKRNGETDPELRWLCVLIIIPIWGLQCCTFWKCCPLHHCNCCQENKNNEKKSRWVWFVLLIIPICGLMICCFCWKRSPFYHCCCSQAKPTPINVNPDNYKPKPTPSYVYPVLNINDAALHDKPKPTPSYVYPVLNIKDAALHDKHLSPLDIQIVQALNKVVIQFSNQNEEFAGQIYTFVYCKTDGNIVTEVPDTNQATLNNRPPAFLERTLKITQDLPKWTRGRNVFHQRILREKEFAQCEMEKSAYETNFMFLVYWTNKKGKLLAKSKTTNIAIKHVDNRPILLQIGPEEEQSDDLQ